MQLARDFSPDAAKVRSFFKSQNHFSTFFSQPHTFLTRIGENDTKTQGARTRPSTAPPHDGKGGTFVRQILKILTLRHLVFQPAKKPRKGLRQGREPSFGPNEGLTWAFRAPHLGQVSTQERPNDRAEKALRAPRKGPSGGPQRVGETQPTENQTLAKRARIACFRADGRAVTGGGLHA